MPQTPKKAETFLGNLMKYSVATYLGFLISGAALIVKGILPPDSYAVPASLHGIHNFPDEYRHVGVGPGVAAVLS